MATGIYLLHHSEDEPLVRPIRDALQKQGWRTWSEDNLLGGQDREKVVRRVLAEAGLVVLCLSRQSLESWGSFQVERRLAQARQKETPDHGIFLIPAFLEPPGSNTFEELVAVRIFETDGLQHLVRAISQQINEDQAKKLRMTESEFETYHREHQALALDRAQETLSLLDGRGEDTNLIKKEIRKIKQRMRQGGVLHPGDWLCHRYKLERILGQGGFAEVWAAFDKQEKSLMVAVKVLHGQYRKDQTRRERFFRGGRRMKALGHSGVVAVFDAGSEDAGFPFFVMEHMPGGDLRRAVLEQRLDPNALIGIIVRVGETLSYAHAMGMVHRDVKPANILLDLAGNPKLTDFDLVWAADTAGGTNTAGMGTYLYAAPEMMVDAKNPDPTADVYGLGMTTLFCLYGRDLNPAVVLGQRDAFINGLALPEQVKTVIARAIDWAPAQRYSEVAAYIKALEEAWVHSKPEMEQFASPAPDSDRSDSGAFVAPDITKTRDRKRFRLAVAIGLFTLLCWGAFYFFQKIDRSQGPTQTADAPNNGQTLPESPVAQVQPSPKHGEKRAFPITEKVSLTMIYLKADSFEMGSNDGDVDEKPPHQVTLSEGFWLAETELTQEQWLVLMPENPSKFKDGKNPVESVSWEDVQVFLQKLNATMDGNPFRLPTEAEWEYACRAGSAEAYSFGPDSSKLAEYGNFCDKNCEYGHKEENQDDGYKTTAPVRSYRPNDWGLYDMHGNVWEWCSDWMAAYPTQETPDPKGPDVGENRVLRGGSWDSNARYCRSAVRDGWKPGDRVDNLGFRLARTTK